MTTLLTLPESTNLYRNECKLRILIKYASNNTKIFMLQHK